LGEVKFDRCPLLLFQHVKEFLVLLHQIASHRKDCYHFLNFSPKGFP
jgi:hypothetical protein